jgi:hypothetical protein
MIVDDLVSAACDQTGLSDFGEEGWREGLEILVGSLNNESALTDLGQEIMVGELVTHLAKRLEVEAGYRAHPEIDEQAIVAPLFGLGMPRTGSTALSFLLACDRSRRSLRGWEADRPCPPPETATEHDDPRIAESQAGLDFTNEMFPDFVGMLPTSATGPQECVVIMAMSFRSQMFEMMAWIPTYSSWLQSCDMEPSYRYHQRVLKLLQWRCPPTRWWLKTPAHMPSIRALDTVYPDARFVMTHREVGTVLVSVCALMQALSSPLTEQVDAIAVGQYNTALWDESLRRLIEFRDEGRDDRFFDVSFNELQSDPIAAMQDLYLALGDPFTRDTELRMRDWWNDHAFDRRLSTYRAETFGLDPATIRDRFVLYHERFGISAE